MNFVHQSGQIIIIHLPEMLGHFGMIPLINHDSRLRSNSEVVMKFTQTNNTNFPNIYHLNPIKHSFCSPINYETLGIQRIQQQFSWPSNGGSFEVPLHRVTVLLQRMIQDAGSINHLAGCQVTPKKGVFLWGEYMVQ